MEFMILLSHLSPTLATTLANRRKALEESCRDREISFPGDAGFHKDLDAALLYSDFIASAITRDPGLLADLLDSGDLEQAYAGGEYSTRLADMAADAATDDQMTRLLGRVRLREMVRIAWRDLTGKSDLDMTLRDLSKLADACIDIAMEFVYSKLRLSRGTPVDNTGKQQKMVVLGMGKLGAGELNFSSDIDLIFAFPREGVVQGSDRQLSNAEFFTSMCQNFIRILEPAAKDTKVFRVDTRLRPYGDSGPLAMSFGALEEYYQTQGREWERYALIKARPVAGDLAEGHRLLRRLNPFIYRRYLDYGAFESFRDMKQRIEFQVRDKRLKNNIKLGAGGIREVEFFGQLFQLIRGGVEPAFQERKILKVLEILARRSCIDKATQNELQSAYEFLRMVENRLQEHADLQTHDIPETSDARLRLALSMGFDSWDGFDAALKAHMAAVHGHFSQLLHTGEDPTDKKTDSLRYLWATINDPQSEDAMNTLSGFENPERIISLLKSLESHANTKKLTSSGRQLIDRLVPKLVKVASSRNDAVTVLARLIDFVITVERRTCYISLLLENPGALANLSVLAEKSPWIISFLSKHPALLDELLDPRTLYAPPDKHQMASELARRMDQIPSSDIEFLMEELCIFKQINTLRIAAADISGDYPLMKVSDHLTWNAETILDAVIFLAWRLVADKYGTPSGLAPGAQAAPGFSAVAYGKFGGIELGYKSDLDLVFIYSADDGMTQGGPRSIENSQFYSLVSQRIIHALTVHTAAGTLYEPDMRLRPSGQSGMIVSHIDGFREYITAEAWTWEHQAIIRARPVSGDPVLQEQFRTIRHHVLTLERDPETLRREVREMRERMRDAQELPDDGLFNLKQGRGGIVDIEFLVQFLVLRYSHDHPALTRWTDNVRLLETLAAEGLLSAGEAADLKDAYLKLRQRLHRLNLQEKEKTAPLEEFNELIGRVFSLYEKILILP